VPEPRGGRTRRVVAVVAALVLVATVSSGSAATAVDSGGRPPSPDPDVVYTDDHRYYASPWYAGAWQEMIPFGCTRAPYYPRDAGCPRARPGKHHGIDMYMPCGTRIRSAVIGRVVRPNLGPAYGRLGLKIRSGRFDYVIGHARRLLVAPGQRVHRGQVVARSGKLAAPDGCHLHFEKRPAGAGYLAAVDPERSLRRTEVVF
jgi:murein DD-endopeptidase MepM/ murein hydrolase activator NlpD